LPGPSKRIGLQPNFWWCNLSTILLVVYLMDAAFQAFPAHSDQYQMIAYPSFFYWASDPCYFQVYMPTHNICTCISRDIFCRLYAEHTVLVCSHYTGMYVRYLSLFGILGSPIVFRNLVMRVLLARRYMNTFLRGGWGWGGDWGNTAVTRVRNTGPCIIRQKAGSLKMNTALEYSTRVVQEGGRRCKKSTLNDFVHLTPLRIPFMNPPRRGKIT
jgi:hypothetical protein